MSKSQFEPVAVIGYGVVSGKVLKTVYEIASKYGNSRSDTIPVTVTTSYGENLLDKEVKCCMSGFGAGLTWAAAILDFGKLDFCKTVVSNL